MEELLREILAELKKLNSGNKVTLSDSTLRMITKISGTDLLVMLDREKSQESARVRTENKDEKQEKLYAVPNLIRKIIDENFSKYVGKVNTPKRIIILNSEAKEGGIAKVCVECEDTSKYEFWAKMA